MYWSSKAERDLEWTIAKQYLKISVDTFAANATKIKRGFLLDKQNTTMVNLKHSFIVFSNIIIAIGGRGDYIQHPRRPSEARIKYGCDETGQLYAVKIELSDDFNLEGPISENKIATDLGVAIPGGQRQIAGTNKWKCYSPYIYFKKGTFDGYLKTIRATMSKDTAYQLAIFTALLVHRLHSGQLSSTNKKYAHLDIKPDNIVIDHANILRFIDCRFSDELEGSLTIFRGTRGYLPLDPLSYSKQNIDIFSLFRVFYLPELCKIQRISDITHPIIMQTRYLSDTWIFSDHMMKSTPRLRAFIDMANDRAQLSGLSALDIIRELTLIRCNLDDSYKPYLLSETALTLTNRLFENHVRIRKEYLAPAIINEIHSWDTINEDRLQQFIRREQEKKMHSAPGGIPHETTAVELNAKSYPNISFFKQANVPKTSMPCMRSDFHPFKKLL